MELEEESTRVYENNSKREKTSGKWGKFEFLKKTSIEPAVCLFSLGFGLMGVQIATLYIQKTCKVGSYFFGNQTFSNEVCDNLFNGSFSDEQKIVQDVTSKVEIVTSILKQIPVVILALFLGPWSDRAGRKMLLILPFIGYVLYCLIFMINIYFFDELVVEFLWFETICSYFGGWVILFIGAYGYISDTTSLKSRTIRIAILDGVSSVGDIIGSYINSYVYEYLGYYGSFGCAAGCFFLGFIIALFMSEEQKVKKDNVSTKGAFNVKNVLESFKVLTKKRPKSMRHIIIILVVAFQLCGFASSGAWSIDYMYIRRKFDWTDENVLVKFWSQLGAYRSAGNMISMFVILPILIRFLKLHDLSIAIICVMCKAMRELVFCFAENKNHLYVLIATALLDILFTQPMRSTLTKIVGPEDVGKVFAAVGSLQAITGFASPIYNIMYIHTLDRYLGTVYLITVGFYAILITMIGYALFFLKRSPEIDPVKLLSMPKPILSTNEM